MNDNIIKYWDKNKNNLENYLKNNHNLISYKDIMEILLEEVLEDKFINLSELDYGHYQGTIIFIFTKDIYQPSVGETYYTYVDYGSCSYCDTLESALDGDDVVNDLLSICLHLIQHIKSF